MQSKYHGTPMEKEVWGDLSLSGSQGLSLLYLRGLDAATIGPA